MILAPSRRFSLSLNDGWKEIHQQARRRVETCHHAGRLDPSKRPYPTSRRTTAAPLCLSFNGRTDGRRVARQLKGPRVGHRKAWPYWAPRPSQALLLPQDPLSLDTRGVARAGSSVAIHALISTEAKRNVRSFGRKVMVQLSGSDRREW